MMKFRDNTIVCGCTTKITLIHGVIKLNHGIKLDYCKDCVYDLLVMLLGPTAFLLFRLLIIF